MHCCRDVTVMALKNVINCVDRTLRDLRDEPHKPFGGVTVFFYGDLGICKTLYVYGPGFTADLCISHVMVCEGDRGSRESCL